MEKQGEKVMGGGAAPLEALQTPTESQQGAEVVAEIVFQMASRPNVCTK